LKKALVIVLCILTVIGIMTACGTESITVSAKQNVIRLHILANSDSDTDQSMKLKVRDLLLEDWSGTLAAAGTATAAWQELNDLLPDIQKDIASLLDGQNAGYGVKLETGVYDFPDRDYNGVVFPAGQYQALRVELGAGSGHNWWCVMFPPLCLIGENGEMNMDEYMDLIEELKDKGITPQMAPDAPVHSWIYDQLFGEKQWNDSFLQWAKEYWTGGEDK
jgi:stage II sporulation protein R